MAFPTYTTNDQLSGFMLTVLGPTGAALEWATGAATTTEIVNDVLIGYGVTDISEATDIEKLRAIARWQAWRWAADALAAEFDVSTDGQSLSLSQLHKQAIAARDAAWSACVPHLSVYAVTATPIIHVDDPVDAPGRYAELRGW